MPTTSPSKKPTVLKKTKRKVTDAPTPEQALMISPIRTLALRFESRVPMIVQQIGLVALLLGIGTLSSVLYLQSSLPHSLSQVAFAVIGTNKAPLDTIAVDKPLTVTFDFEEPLSDVRTLQAVSTAGTKMQAMIRGKTTGLKTVLPLISESPGTKTWTFKVDVRELPAGEYQFISRVLHNGIWQENISRPFTVVATNTVLNNNTLTVESENASSTNIAREIQIGRSVSVQFVALPAELTGVQQFELEAVGISDVEIKFLNRNGKTAAIYKSEPNSARNYFIFNIDTTKVVNGEYNFVATFKHDNERITSPGKIIKVNNPVIARDGPATSTETISQEQQSFSVKKITTNTLERYQTYEFASPNLNFVEVYTKSFTQTSPQLNGLAIRQSDTTWRYTIDTSKLPKGSYMIVVKYKQNEELKNYTGSPFMVNYQQPEPSILDTATAKPPSDIPVETIERVIKLVNQEVPPTVPLFKPKRDIGVTVNSDNSTDENLQIIQEKVSSKQNEIEDAINSYTAALRSGDEQAITKSKNRVRAIGTITGIASIEDNSSEEITIARHLEDLIRRAEKIEVIVKERTQNTISVDTDGDGITDFDEVSLYETDPNNPDTDNDGFNDGAEILAGFDPLNSTSEVSITYESPKSAGVTRSDIFAVNSVVAITEKEPVADGVLAQAEISGVGLPNSFITLFIFSTPIVVTLKTDNDGSWTYTFDKELEDGTHEVYVGVTDNTGAIVAKSNPFRFIKEAQAFTPLDAENSAPQGVSEARGLESPVWQAAIFGLIIFIVGLILIILGQQLERSKRDNIVSEV